MPFKQILFLIAICACVHGAPRRSSSTTFDQKQTGEYNIQLHLKDFQIIAVVGDDSFGGLGDYDYNYDYSDFTVKPSPSSSSTTKKPEITEPALTSTSAPTTENGELTNFEITSKPSTKKPTVLPVSHPYPIISPSTTTTTKPLLITTTIKSPTNEATQKPSINENSVKPLTSELIEKVSTTAPLAPSVNSASSSAVTSIVSSSTSAPSSTVKIIALTSTSSPTTFTTSATTIKEKPTTSRPITIKPQTQQIPGQIPVVVQDFSIVRNETPIVKDKNHDKKLEVVTSVTIVPLEDTNSGELAVNEHEQPTLGEILHYRRCAQGYQRDKRGRCRKVRRPQIPLGLTRFASSFAARLRQAGSTPAESEEIRDDTIVP